MVSVKLTIVTCHKIYNSNIIMFLKYLEVVSPEQQYDHLHYVLNHPPHPLPSAGQQWSPRDHHVYIVQVQLSLCCYLIIVGERSTRNINQMTVLSINLVTTK